jgi:hypothetical protein
MAKTIYLQFILEIGLNNPLNLPLRTYVYEKKLIEGLKAQTKMQLPTIDRTPNLRPSGADAVSAVASKVVPVAPVNPSVASRPSLDAVPSVVDLVNPALKTNSGEPIYTSVSDPGRPGSEAATVSKDWTIHRPVTEKVEDPPPKPIYQVLIDHIKNVWLASASVVQMAQVNNQLNPPTPTGPSDTPGNLAKEVLVYDQNIIKKNERL